MVMRIGLVVPVILFCLSSAFGQTVAELEAKYGNPTAAYSVSETIWMTPEFTADGQVCRMRIYPKRISSDTNYLLRQLQFAELTKVLNVLVPTGKRGKKNESFGATATGGPAAWTTYAYENVTFTFVSSFSPMKFAEAPPLRKGEFVFSTPEKGPDPGPESSAPTIDDFRNSRSSLTEVVTIKWNNRKCVGN
jgi:hypothetical protein